MSRSGRNIAGGSAQFADSGLWSIFAGVLDSPGELDIAHVNLLCASGLPHGNPDIASCLATLDEWTRRVADETRRMWPDWVHDQAYYDHDEAVFRMMALVTVLQRDIGIRYNPEAVGEYDFSDSRDSFIHGLLTGRRLGTCVNIPVLYVAVGRRLGYPVSLALAKGHYFVRWEKDDGTHLNFDGTNLGLSVHEDDHYRNWPRAISDEELEDGVYLRPLTRAEELACFLGSRGHCLEDNERYEEAAECYERAAGLMPCSSYFPAHLRILRVKMVGGLSRPSPVDFVPPRAFATVEGIAVGYV